MVLQLACLPLGVIHSVFLQEEESPLKSLAEWCWALGCKVGKSTGGFLSPLTVQESKQTLGDAQRSVHGQPDVGVALRPIDNRIVCPQAQPVVGSQGGHMIAHKEGNAQERDEEPDCFHVVPVH